MRRKKWWRRWRKAIVHFTQLFSPGIAICMMARGLFSPAREAKPPPHGLEAFQQILA